MKKLIFSFLIVLLLPMQAYAAKWYEVTQSYNGDIYYIDLDSIDMQGDNVYYWEKVLYKNIKKIKSEDNYVGKSKVSYTVSYSADNCFNDTATELRFSQYGTKGQNLLTGPYSNPSFTLVQPDTVGSSVHKAVCFCSEKAKDGADGATLYQLLYEKDYTDFVYSLINEAEYALNKHNLKEAFGYELSLASYIDGFPADSPVRIKAYKCFSHFHSEMSKITDGKQKVECLNKAKAYEEKAMVLEQRLSVAEKSTNDNNYKEINNVEKKEISIDSIKNESRFIVNNAQFNDVYTLMREYTSKNYGYIRKETENVYKIYYINNPREISLFIGQNNNDVLVAPMTSTYLMKDYLLGLIKYIGIYYPSIKMID